MKQLFIFPCNGNGLEALDCVDSSLFEFLGFIDDTPEKQGMNQLGFHVYSRNILNEFSEALVLAVPGSPSSFQFRDEIIKSLGINFSRFATVIHPKASISRFAKIGNNVLIMSGVVIPFNAVIEDNVCILPNSVIHHDSIVGKNTLIGSNVTVAGYTSIGSNCYIGSGTSIINNISIGDKTLVGMGTNVIKSIEENKKVVGNPAREI